MPPARTRAPAAEPVPIGVIGAGGHGKVVVATAFAAGHRVAWVADDDAAHWGKRVLGVEVRGPIADVLAADDGRSAVVVGIGRNDVRARLAARLPDDRCCPALIHPSAVVAPECTLGVGTVVFAGVVLQPGGRVGRHAILNTRSSIDHDAVVGDLVHVGPGAAIAGDVRIGDGAFIGTGAAVIPGMSVGRGVVVGAGSVVIRPIPDGTVVAGVPARPLRNSAEAT